MKWILWLVAAVAAWQLWRLFQIKAESQSLREDRPAPAKPTTAALVKNSPIVDALFSLPTIAAGRAPAPSWSDQWSYEDVALIFRENDAGFNKLGTEGGHA